MPDAAIDTLEPTPPVAPKPKLPGRVSAREETPVLMPSVPPASAEDGPSRAEEDRRLLIRYHRHGDAAAREQLVQRLLPLARRMARRYRRSDEPLDDLIQVATLGLIKAIDRFDPARETAFSSYSVPTMLGELKRYFRDNGWAGHVPRGMQERVMHVDATVKDLSRRHGRSPSVTEIGTATRLTPEQVLEAMEAASAYDAVSLESYRFGDEGDGETYADSIGMEDDRYELVEYGATIEPTLQALPARDRIVLHLRFVEDMTQAEIAERVGVSQMHVSRLIRRALERLRTVAEHWGCPAPRGRQPLEQRAAREAPVAGDLAAGELAPLGHVQDRLLADQQQRRGRGGVQHPGLRRRAERGVSHHRLLVAQIHGHMAAQLVAQGGEPRRRVGVHEALEQAADQVLFAGGQCRRRAIQAPRLLRREAYEERVLLCHTDIVTDISARAAQRSDFEPHMGRALVHPPALRHAVHEMQAPAAGQGRLRVHLHLRPLAVAL